MRKGNANYDLRPDLSDTNYDVRTMMYEFNQ